MIPQVQCILSTKLAWLLFNPMLVTIMIHLMSFSQTPSWTSQRRTERYRLPLRTDACGFWYRVVIKVIFLIAQPQDLIIVIEAHMFLAAQFLLENLHVLSQYSDVWKCHDLVIWKWQCWAMLWVVYSKASKGQKSSDSFLSCFSYKR